MTKYIGPKTDGENVATQADKLSLSSDTPDALTPDQSGAAGTAVTAARADHQHEILAASAGTITGTNAEGSSTSFARADHDHAHGNNSVPLAALPLLDGCQLNRTGATVANDSAFVVTFGSGTEVFDNNDLHSTSSNTARITVKTAGIYVVTANFFWTDNNFSGIREGFIRVNGTRTVGGRQSAAVTFQLVVNLSLIWSASVNDYFDCEVFNGSGGGTRSFDARFSAQLVSRNA